MSIPMYESECIYYYYIRLCVCSNTKAAAEVEKLSTEAIKWAPPSRDSATKN